MGGEVNFYLVFFVVIFLGNVSFQVEPLRNELKRLESDAKKKTNEGNEVKARIAQLEQSIAAYKEEYAQLIGQAESIKMDLATVQEKVREFTPCSVYRWSKAIYTCCHLGWTINRAVVVVEI